jgi:tetratricopeptide (TPR) repeat protein
MSKYFPHDPKKIRERIKRYERAFKEPHHDDGAGKRLLLGQLYMLMGDLEGALKHYTWYQKKFPDEIPEPFNHFCWSLALLRSGDEKSARAKLRELIFDNLYLVPIFLGEEPKKFDMWHGSNWSEPAYVLEGPMEELFAIWSESERNWLKTEWSSRALQTDIAKYVDLQRTLSKTSGPEARRKVINESDRVARGQSHLSLVK